MSVYTAKGWDSIKPSVSLGKGRKDRERGQVPRLVASTRGSLSEGETQGKALRCFNSKSFKVLGQALELSGAEDKTSNYNLEELKD